VLVRAKETDAVRNKVNRLLFSLLNQDGNILFISDETLKEDLSCLIWEGLFVRRRMFH
jgi:hypothetical protein